MDIWVSCYIVHCVARLSSGRVLDLRSTGRGFESQLPHCRVQPWASCYHTYTSVTKQYNLLPANGRWCLAAGNVIIGLALHWPRVTDINVLHLWAQGCGQADDHPPSLSCGVWSNLHFFKLQCTVFAVVWFPSVCPSVTFVHSIHMAEDIVKLHYRPGSPIILAFWPQSPEPNSKGNLFSGGTKYNGGEKILWFSTEISIYLRNGTR